MNAKLVRVGVFVVWMLGMLFALLPTPARAACAADANYRSAQTGNWGDAATWECYNGTAWESAASAPDYNAGTITIQNGHTVTVAASVTTDQTVVESGGQVTISSGNTLTITNGAETDFQIDGTVLNQGTLGVSSSPTWTVSAGGTFIHNSNRSITGALDRATLDTSSTFVYRDSGSAVSLSNRTYGNLAFETASSWSPSPSGGNPLTVQGDFSVGSGVTLNVSGFTGDIRIAGDWDNDGTFTAGNSTVTLNGTAGQIVGGSSATTFANFTVSNTVGVTLTTSATVNGTLTLTSGDLGTGSNTLTLGSSATVAGTGDVVGNVRRTGNFSTGTNYQFNNAQTLINFSSVTNGTSPSIIVNLSKSAPTGLTTAVPRVYAITPSDISSYNATLQLGYKDTETGGMTEDNLRAWRYNGARWALQAGSVDTTNNYVSATNVTAFSDWAITDNGAPTAVALSSFDAHADAPNALLLVGLGALAVLALGAGAYAKSL